MSLLNGRLKKILGEQVKQLYIKDLDWDEEDEDLIKKNIEVEVLEELKFNNFVNISIFFL